MIRKIAKILRSHFQDNSIPEESLLVDELESDDQTLRVFRIFVKVAEQSLEEEEE